jgi:hypothetical protein
LILKGAVERVHDPFQSPGFYSRLFLVPKKTGGMRPVIDLSILNTFLLVPHFKMETNRSIISCIHPGMWTTSLDLMDAYFHIPIAPPFRKFLRFVWDNTVYQFRTLPFGISTAPLVFTRVFQTVIAHDHLHTLSIQIHSYLDDSLIKDFDQQTLVSQTEMVIQLFLNLGFFISWKKSELTPSQNFLFLGEHYRTDLGLIFPPEEKLVSLCQRILLFQNSQFVTARQYSQLLGFLNSLAAPTVLSSSTLASSLSRLGSKDHSSSFTVTSPTVVDKQGECDVSTSSYPNSLHRCFQPGLGSLSRGKLGLRVVVSSTTEGTHQPVGDESSSSGIVSFQNNSPSPISDSGNRQYYRSRLSEKPGRHSLFQPVFSLQGDSPSLLGTSDSTGSEAYSGSSQCTSRHTVTFSNTSEHGMGITTSNFQCHQSSLGSSSSGSVCYVSEPQAGYFRFSSSRSSSIRCRRNVNLLERNVHLRFPSLQVSFPSPSKGGSEILQDHSYCTGLAKTSLVHRSAASLVCKITSSSSQSEYTVSAERKNNASKSRESASARMVTLRKGI